MVWVEKMKRGTYKFEIVFIDDSTVIFETVPNNFVRVRLSDETWEYFERFDRFYNKWVLILTPFYYSIYNGSLSNGIKLYIVEP